MMVKQIESETIAIAKGFYANDAVLEVLIGLTKFSPSCADNWPLLHTNSELPNMSIV